jgi:PAS domain S-box-containing protein
MFETLSSYFGSGGLAPPDGGARWAAELPGLYVFFNLLAGIAFCSIAAALWYVTRRRSDLPFKWMFGLFAAFMLAYGAVHLLEVWNLGRPVYWLDAGVRALAAAAAAAMAAALWSKMPRILALQACQPLTASAFHGRQTDVSGPRQQGDALFKSLFEWMPDAIVVADAAGRIVLANAQAERLFGYGRSELVGRPVEALMPARYRDAHAAHRAGFMDHPRPRPMGSRTELRAQIRDGREFPVDIMLAPLALDGQTLVLGVVRDITEQKRAERALREREEHFRYLFEANPMPMWVRDEETDRFLAVNDAAVRLYGYTREEFLGMTGPDIRPPEDRAAYLEFSRQREARLKTVRRWRHRKKDGVLIEVEVTVHSFTYQGRFARLALIGDITERLRAERELHESEERYRRVIEMSPSPILLRREEHVIFGNAAAVRFFAARSAEDLVGRAYFDLIDPEERERSKQRWETIRDAGMATPPEVRKYRRVDGGIVYGETSGAPFQYGAERCGITTIHDVTGQRKAAEALATERNLLRSVIDTLPDQVYVKDRGRRYILVNAASLKDRGLESHDDVVGKTVYDFYPRESAAAFDAEDDAVIRSGEPILNREQSRVTSHGEARWYFTDKVPLRDAEGAVIGVIGINRDVTEVRVATEAIRRLNAELEERVRERTAELEVANKELESFAYSVSHDLRAPLRSIDGFSRALLEDYRDRLDNTGKDYLRRVRNATLRMGNLIDDLLTLSRITRSEMRQENVNVSAVAREIAAELQTDDPEREVEFEIQNGIRAKADPSLLRVALQNLLYNAWKFTGRAAKSRIEFGSVRGDGRQVYFVRDNGVGFDMTYADKLFGAFQRLHSESEFPGTGVGLATVQRIVRRHGGEVWAEGAVDRGATFFFTLGRAGKQRAHADAASDTDG